MCLHVANHICCASERDDFAAPRIQHPLGYVAVMSRQPQRQCVYADFPTPSWLVRFRFTRAAWASVNPVNCSILVLQRWRVQ